MRYYLMAMALLCLYACSTVSINQTVNVKTNSEPIKVYSSYDSVWNKVIEYLLTNSFTIVSKDKSEGAISVELKNVKLTTYFKKKTPKYDSTAFAIAEVMKRRTGGDILFAKKGNLNYQFTFLRIGENDISVFVVLKSPGSITEWKSDDNTKGTKLIPNVKMWSTGYFENVMRNYLK